MANVIKACADVIDQDQIELATASASRHAKAMASAIESYADLIDLNLEQKGNVNIESQRKDFEDIDDPLKDLNANYYKNLSALLEENIDEVAALISIKDRDIAQLEEEYKDIKLG